MSNQNEANQEPSEILDEDTKQTLDELEKEGHTVERPDKPAPEPEAPKPEEPAKDDADKKLEEEKERGKGDPSKDEKLPKEPSTMPRFEHAIAVKRLEKQNSELQSKIEELTKANSEGKSPAEKAEIVDDIEALAKELGFDDDQKTAVQKIVDVAVKKATPQLPAELHELINNLPALKQVTESHKAQAAEQAFNDDFDTNVVPLVEQEYPGISAEHLSTIKKVMREKASHDDLISTPLPLIYKGMDDFRGIVKSPSRSIDSSRGGANRNDSVIDFENMSEEQFLKLSPDDQDRFADYMAEKERNKNKK